MVDDSWYGPDGGLHKLMTLSWVSIICSGHIMSIMQAKLKIIYN
jgi:hypothetical protein